MPNNTNSPKSSAIYLSHGGGPLPLLGDPSHQNLINFLRDITQSLIQPKAILVISAHWEESVPTFTSGEHPALIYDYYGFPANSYTIQYPAPGAPTLATALNQQLHDAGINTRLDNCRGFDHGLFVPLKLMYPEANIPCVQLSLVNNLNSAIHIQLGKALAEWKNQDILVIGSGFSFHNLNAFFAPTTPESQVLNQAFEQWLKDTCCNQHYTETEREQLLVNWVNAPAARYCHPREEHLLPLHVCYGFAGTAAKQAYEIEVLGKLCSAYVW